MVVLGDGRGIYGPRSVKFTWNGRGSGGVGEKWWNKCLNKLQMAGVGLVIVSLCNFNYWVQNLGKVCCRNTSAAKQKQLRLLKWTEKDCLTWSQRLLIPQSTRNITKGKKIIWRKEWSILEVWYSTGRRDTALLRTKRRVKRKTLGGSFAAVSCMSWCSAGVWCVSNTPW